MTEKFILLFVAYCILIDMLKRFESTIPLPDDLEDAAIIAVSSYQGIGDLPMEDMQRVVTYVEKILADQQLFLDFQQAQPVVAKAEEYLIAKLDEWDLDNVAIPQPMGVGFEFNENRGGFAQMQSRFFGFKAGSEQAVYDLVSGDPFSEAVAVHELTHVYGGITIEKDELNNQLYFPRMGIQRRRDDKTYDFPIFLEAPSCWNELNFMLTDRRNAAQLSTGVFLIMRDQFPAEVIDDIQHLAIEIQPEAVTFVDDQRLAYPAAVVNQFYGGNLIVGEYDHLCGSLATFAGELYDNAPMSSLARDLGRAHVTTDREDLFALIRNKMGDDTLTFLSDLNFRSPADMALLGMYTLAGQKSQPEVLRERLGEIKDEMKKN